MSPYPPHATNTTVTSVIIISPTPLPRHSPPAATITAATYTITTPQIYHSHRILTYTWHSGHHHPRHPIDTTTFTITAIPADLRHHVATITIFIATSPPPPLLYHHHATATLVTTAAILTTAATMSPYPPHTTNTTATSVSIISPTPLPRHSLPAATIIAATYTITTPQIHHSHRILTSTWHSEHHHPRHPIDPTTSTITVVA
nr:hypothetical protein [Tanacetum cinerariifolium]